MGSLERNVAKKIKQSTAALIRYFCAKSRNGKHSAPGTACPGGTRTFPGAGCLLVLGKEPDEQIFSKPPFVCVEILSAMTRWKAPK